METPGENHALLAFLIGFCKNVVRNGGFLMVELWCYAQKHGASMAVF
jgi:hypothetical protein